MIGSDRNSAIQPSRSNQTATTSSPAITAVIADEVDVVGCCRSAAKTPRPAAKRGAIVESAPTDS